ncbi:hypothetical protein [Corynebacterium sp.]|uniref:hypothetical protein n=1 Tax=Corynebacterium sp. TaxID=1720 RepID=UPI003736A373
MIDAGILDRNPYLLLHADTHIVDVVLPTLAADHGLNEPTWVVEQAFADGSTRTRHYPAPVGDDYPVRVGIPAAFTGISVELRDGENLQHGPVTFRGLNDEYPFLLLHDGERSVNPAGGILQLNYTLLAPKGTTVEGAAATHEHALGPWAGWSSISIDAHGVDSLTVQVPGGEAIDVTVAGHPVYEWDFGVATLPNAETEDREPVYTTSPNINIFGAGQWFLELTYAPLGGEQELVHEAELEQGGLYEVFPAEAYDEAWVGRYKVVLYRGDDVVDTRFLAIAEGLHMRAKNEGPKGTDFRFIDITGALSPFNYVLAGTRAKPLGIDGGQKRFSSTETSRLETVTSDSGYELTFVVVPETLRTRVVYDGAEPAEFREKITIPAAALAAGEKFTVYSPRPLPLAKLVTLDPLQGVKNLVNTLGTDEAVFAVSVNNKALVREVREKPSCELYLLWSEVTYDEYLDGLGEKARAVHLKRSQEHRVMEYEAEASQHLIYAALATVEADAEV